MGAHGELVAPPMWYPTPALIPAGASRGSRMPSKPRTLAGILRLRRHADRAYNLVQRDPATARIHGSARWQAVRALVLRDELAHPEGPRPGSPAPALRAAGARVCPFV